MNMVKKSYKMPECVSVKVETASFLTNSYHDDQGWIKYDSEMVGAEDSD